MGNSRLGRINRLTRLAAIAAGIGMAGCAVVPILPDLGASGDLTVSRTSPTQELVVPGFAELVLTDRRYPTFDDAASNAVMMVTDGSPLYANIRASRTLGELALPPDPDGPYQFSRYPRLYLHVGDDESLRNRQTCYVTLSPDEIGLHQLVVPLAPLSQRPGDNAADCWLIAATDGGAGQQVHEIRLAGFAGRREAWLPVADLLAVSTVATDFGFGAPRYAAMLETAPSESESASAPATVRSAAAPVVADDRPTIGLIAQPVVPAMTPLPRVDAIVADRQSRVMKPVLATEPGLSSVPGGPARVVIHHQAGDPAGAARARHLRDRLQAQRDLAVEIRTVPSMIASDNMRVFFEADRQSAQSARSLLAGEAMPIRDFTDYRPSPRPGTIEIWLASSI